MRLNAVVFSLLLLAGALPHVLEAQEESLWVAAFADGVRVPDGRLSEWHDPGAQPKINGRPLLDPNSHVRWLREQSAQPTPTPTAFVETFDHDRLPGRVERYNVGTLEEPRGWAAHFEVLSDPSWNLPFGPSPGPTRVLPAWVRRIAWQARSDGDYRPSTAFFLDGRELGYRSLKFNETSVTLLLEQGTREVSFGELAELHLPARDAWDCYYDTLAVVSPTCESRLTRIETTDGLRLTTSVERFQARHHGNAGEPRSWYHLAQPAWSATPLWVPQARVFRRRYFLPHEVPFPLVEPAEAEQRPLLGGSWPWQRDRDVQGGWLRTGETEFGWGIGVHGDQRLVFELPALATSFQTQVGLDDAAGQGGCARAAVYLNSMDSAPLFQSPVLVGSTQAVDTGVLALAASSESRRLILQIDPVHEGKPAGADPLDIRDLVDWLDPQLTLDRERLVGEVQGRAAATMPAWEGWKLASGTAIVMNRLEGGDPLSNYFSSEVRPSESFLVLSRRLFVPKQGGWLVAVATRHPDGNLATPSRIQIRVGGRPIAEFEVPAATGGLVDPDELAVPLDNYRGQSINVEVVQMADSDKSWVRWKQLGLADHPPGLIELVADAVPAGADGIELEKSDRYSGAASIRLPAGKSLNVPLAADVDVYPTPRWGEYRLLRFAWKKPDGERVTLQVKRPPANNLPPDTPATQYWYSAGQRRPGEHQELVHLNDKLPEQWEVVTRDLRQDFRVDFAMSGLEFVADGGGPALIDHVYLARTESAFQYCPSPMTAETTGWPATLPVLRREESRTGIGRLLAETTPGFATTTLVADQGLALLKEYAGRERVVTAFHGVDGQPLRLHAALDLPAGTTAKLQLELTNQREPAGQWQVTVRAAGETLHDAMIAAKAEDDGWHSIEVDLAKLAGKKAVLEVECRPHSGRMFWSRMAVVQP